jgi:hypothetical protein
MLIMKWKTDDEGRLVAAWRGVDERAVAPAWLLQIENWQGTAARASATDNTLETRPARTRYQRVHDLLRPPGLCHLLRRGTALMRPGGVPTQRCSV